MIIEKLAYSLHLGSDKNKKNNIRKSAKKNTSGTTSMSNNAIQNARTLSKVDNHNYRKYDDNHDDIQIIKGTHSLYNDVKELYKNEFEEARFEYNSKQNRKARMIEDYFTNVSNNDKNDLACEIIIELGDKKYWDTKDMKFKKRMTNVYKNQVNDLETMLPNFKIASAIIHYDETSPHLHIIGVPIKLKNKNGMSKQVGKSDVFTKDSLTKLQDQMRTLCIESFNKEYKLDNSLKPKLKGRNQDINVADMTNYQSMKDELERNKNNLEKANKKSLELDTNSKDIKDKIQNLKQSKLNKDHYILSDEDKNNLFSYIDKVDKTNSDYKNITDLSITLNNVNDELNYDKSQIQTLTENNQALSLRVTTLTKIIDKKEKEISNLKEENKSLKFTLDYWKNKFFDIVNFIKNKMFSKKQTREKYMDITNDLYNEDIIENTNYFDIKENYEWNQINDKDRKEKDDFEL